MVIVTILFIMLVCFPIWGPFACAMYDYETYDIIDTEVSNILVEKYEEVDHTRYFRLELEDGEEMTLPVYDYRTYKFYSEGQEVKLKLETKIERQGGKVVNKEYYIQRIGEIP